MAQNLGIRRAVKDHLLTVTASRQELINYICVHQHSSKELAVTKKKGSIICAVQYEPIRLPHVAIQNSKIC